MAMPIANTSDTILIIICMLLVVGLMFFVVPYFVPYGFTSLIIITIYITIITVNNFPFRV